MEGVRLVSTLESNDEYQEAVKQTNLKTSIVKLNKDLQYTTDEKVLNLKFGELGVTIFMDNKPFASVTYKNKSGIIGESYDRLFDSLRMEVFNGNLSQKEMNYYVDLINSFDLEVRKYEDDHFIVRPPYTDYEDEFSVAAVKDGKVISYSHCSVSDGIGDILSVETDESFRNRGLCKQVISESFRLFRELKVEIVKLKNFAGSIGHKCYEKAAEENRYILYCEETEDDHCFGMIFTTDEFSIE